MSPVPLAWRFFALLAVLFIVAPLAFAQEPKGIIFDCKALADGIGAAAAYRDVGADLSKTIAFYRSRAQETPEPRKAVVEREIRRMWREGLPGAEAAFAVYKRCEAQLGDMGRGT